MSNRIKKSNLYHDNGYSPEEIVVRINNAAYFRKLDGEEAEALAQKEALLNNRDNRSKIEAFYKNPKKADKSVATSDAVIQHRLALASEGDTTESRLEKVLQERVKEQLKIKKELEKQNNYLRNELGIGQEVEPQNARLAEKLGWELV